MERRAAQAAATCGCKTGAATTLLAAVAWPAWVAVRGLTATAAGIGWAVGGFVLVVIGAALVGKLVGVGAGRVQGRWLRFRVARLRR